MFRTRIASAERAEMTAGPDANRRQYIRKTSRGRSGEPGARFF
jgi:hypothetical protein